MHSFFKLLSVALFFVSLSSYAQAPPGINYQAVARDKEGKALASRDVSVRVSILQDSENGETEYAERHLVKTNPFGLFMLVIGHGETIQGNFNFISWAVGNKWLKIELDPDGGNLFQLMGSQQLMSVPYAFYAKYSGNGYVAGPGISINNATITNTGDADNNPSNELISQISFDADKKLRITEAGTTREADLSSLIGANQNLEQVLAQGNDAGGKKITNAGTPAQPNDLATKAYVDSHVDSDSDKQNEIQDLQLSTHTLTITNKTNATLIDLSPYLDNTDSQSLSLDGSTLTISGGNSVNLAAVNTDAQLISLTGNSLSISGGNSIDISTINTDQQDLSRSGNTLSLSGDGTTVDLSPFLDNTDNQDLTLSGNTLSLSNDATTVSLAPYLDNTDAQTLSTQSVDTNTRSIAITGGNTLNIDVRDADASSTNEIQDLSITGNTLSLSSDGTTVNLAPYLDNTDAQNLSYNGTTRALAISGGNSVTVTQTLSQVLSEGNSAGSRQIKDVTTPTANNDAANKQYVDDADAVLAARISTTYAFKTAFAYTNTTPIAVSDQTIPFTSEDFDDFNVLSTNSFTANENGIYSFTIYGSYSALATGGQLSLLYNGVKHPIFFGQAWGGIGAQYNATMMFKMTAGQSVTLIGDNVLVGGVFSGSFFGYKL